MHIGIDASRAAIAARTGTEHYTYELIGALARRDRMNRYTLYANQPPAALPPIGPNVALRRIPFSRLWTHARLSAELLRHPPDVLFVPAHVVPLGAPFARNLATVVTIHDMGYLYFPEAHTRAQRLYLRLSTVWSARVASRVIAISSATRDDLILHAGIPPEQIRVILHGVAPRFTPQDAAQVAAVRQRYDVPERYFLYVGTVQPRKNLVRLIEAFAQSSEAMPDPPTLVIAGKRGWLTEAIEQQARQQAPGRVRFVGYVPDADMPALYSGALAFVFPSLYEGFGMPVLEAMACGTPVLTSNTSSLPEVAGSAALLVDPHSTTSMRDAFTRLATSDALRADLARLGSLHAAQFTWDACAANTLDVLQEAVASHRRSSFPRV